MKANCISLITIILLAIGHTYAQDRIEVKHGAHRSGKRTDAEMKKWREHGLGQFIHWGVYAIPGGTWEGKTYRGAAEWIRVWNGDAPENWKDTYDNLYKDFNPTQFDATRWARQAREMGVRYLVFTTKHHDGFCLWPSRFTDYTVANTPYGKDIVREIVDAYTAEGIDVHLYFSIIDWNHPGFYEAGNINSGSPERDKLRADPASYDPFSGAPDPSAAAKGYERFKEFTRNQLLELLDNYPSIKGLWFDGSWDMAWVKNAPWVDSLGIELRDRHKGLIIGSRFRSDEYGYRHFDINGNLIDDYCQIYERNLPKTKAEVAGFDWDCVMTVPENQWGYHKDWSLTYVKDSYELIRMLAKANSMGGNLVINFGPDGEGNIREEESQIAVEIGRWMQKNAEAIYEVYPCPLEEQDWGYYTQSGNGDIYMIVFNKPLNNKVRVKTPMANKGHVNIVSEAEFIASKNKGEVRYGGRDKEGFYYYDIVLSPDYQNILEPFVIKIKLKEVAANSDEYQQAIT